MILSNSVICLECNDTIYSKHRHDFVQCSCGNIAVDGGMEYLRRIGNVSKTKGNSVFMKNEDVKECKAAIREAIDTDRNELGILCAVMRTLKRLEYDFGYDD